MMTISKTVALGQLGESPTEKNGAGEEVRTLDIYLGKVMLYQLSYARIYFTYTVEKVYTMKLVQVVRRTTGKRGSVFVNNLSYYTPLTRARLWSRHVDKHMYHPA